MQKISAQPGPQTAFLSTPADIAIFGGSAGGGKSHALLMEPLRHVSVPGFGAVLFRRKAVEITLEGGFADSSAGLYFGLGGVMVKSPRHEWRFPAGSKIQFGHLEHTKNRFDWQGSQIAMLGFDELTHFESEQWWYLLSRNRSVAGVRPYVRATTNPDADSWVAELIAWWIDQDTGYAIPERAGVLRYFVRVGDTLMWGDTPEELAEHTDDQGDPLPPKSLTFIPSSLADNRILMQQDPGYRANLLALGTVERERLLHGNWKIRPKAGLYFKREWVEVHDVAPKMAETVRGWDLAATESRPGENPDWTTGTKMGKTADGQFWILDHVYDRVSPARVERMIKNTAARDGRECRVHIPQDPGQAGKAQVVTMARLLAGFNVRFKTVTGDKITRFSPFSAQAEAGNVNVVRGDWNERWFSELENFPPETDRGHDDDADSTAAAFDALIRRAPRAAKSTYSMR